MSCGIFVPPDAAVNPERVLRAIRLNGLLGIPRASYRVAEGLGAILAGHSLGPSVVRTKSPHVAFWIFAAVTAATIRLVFYVYEYLRLRRDCSLVVSVRISDMHNDLDGANATNLARRLAHVWKCIVLG